MDDEEQALPASRARRPGGQENATTKNDRSERKRPQRGHMPRGGCSFNEERFFCVLAVKAAFNDSSENVFYHNMLAVSMLALSFGAEPNISDGRRCNNSL